MAPVRAPLVMEFQGSSFPLTRTKPQSIVEKSPPHTAKLPANTIQWAKVNVKVYITVTGVLNTTGPPHLQSVELELSLLLHSLSVCVGHPEILEHSWILPLKTWWAEEQTTVFWTHSRGISKALDCLEHSSSNCSHCESTSTVIYYPPGAAFKEKWISMWQWGHLHHT